MIELLELLESIGPGTQFWLVCVLIMQYPILRYTGAMFREKKTVGNFIFVALFVVLEEMMLSIWAQFIATYMAGMLIYKYCKDEEETDKKVDMDVR